MSGNERVSGSGGVGWAGVVVFGAFGWGAFLWLQEWWAVNGVSVLRWARLVGVATLGGVLMVLAAMWWWRRRSARAAGRPVGEGWAPGDRDVFAVVPAPGAARKQTSWDRTEAADGGSGVGVVACGVASIIWVGFASKCDAGDVGPCWGEVGVGRVG